MDIVDVCGDSLANMYALVCAESWEPGMPQGLLHRVGTEWRLIEVFPSSWYIRLRCTPNALYLLDRPGTIVRATLGFEWSEIELPTMGFCNDMLVNDDQTLIVGREGLLIAGTAEHFESVRHHVSTNLTSVTAAGDEWTIAGAMGSLYRFADGHLTTLSEPLMPNMTSASIQMIDSTTFAVASTSWTKRESVIRVMDKNGEVLSATRVDSVITRLTIAPGSREIYCASLSKGIVPKGILRLDGNSVASVLERGTLNGITTVGNHVVAYGTRNTLIAGPEPWERIPLELSDHALQGW